MVRLFFTLRVQQHVNSVRASAICQSKRDNSSVEATQSVRAIVEILVFDVLVIFAKVNEAQTHEHIDRVRQLCHRWVRCTNALICANFGPPRLTQSETKN